MPVALAPIAATFAKSAASTTSALINKALGHSARVKRKEAQTQVATRLGVSYECIRVRDAAQSAGVKFTGVMGEDTCYQKLLAANEIPAGYDGIAHSGGVGMAPVVSGSQALTPNNPDGGLQAQDMTRGQIRRNQAGGSPVITSPSQMGFDMSGFSGGNSTMLIIFGLLAVMVAFFAGSKK